MATSNDTPTNSATTIATNEPYVIEDCFGILKLMNNGTVIRSDDSFDSITFPDDGSVESKDILFDPSHSLHVRLYRPVETSPNTKLPVLAYFHGGGFCIGSRTWPYAHAACRRLSAELPALFLSFDYRLAPEHRLPAAIEDAEVVLLWIKSQYTGPNTDPWLTQSADFTKVFISGESAGGNMAHHIAVKFGPNGLNPMQIRGFILLVPALIGEELTKSELECPTNALLNRDAFDRYVRLALPPGATRNHPACNAFGPESTNLETVEMGSILVVTAERDMLIDANLNYVKKLKEMGKNVEMVQIAGEEHPFFALKPLSESTGEVIRAIGRFMSRTSDGSV